MAQSIRDMLSDGDRRSIGRADEIADLVRRQPRRAGGLVECLWDQDGTVVARAANALEKSSRERPSILAPYKEALFGLLVEAERKELRWQLALMIPRLQLTAAECTRAAATLEGWLEDSSSIVKTFAMQGLADLIAQNPSSEAKVLDTLRAASRSGIAAMRARGRILLKRLERGRK
jgi:hypothetical protein